MGWVAPGVCLYVRQSLSPHHIEYMAIHQRPDAFALMGRMNGIEADVAALLLAIDLVMDKTYNRSAFFCYMEPLPFA